jgi:Ca2+-dependent lipid-binding protein
VFGKTDPYCVLTYGEVTYTTATLKKTYNPVWKETVVLRTTNKTLYPLSLGAPQF